MSEVKMQTSSPPPSFSTLERQRQMTVSPTAQPIPTATKSAIATKRSAKRDPKWVPTTRRRRVEIDGLRITIRDLESELERLQSRKRHNAASSDESSESDEDSEQALMWAAIALSEQLQLEEAEHQRTKLQRLLHVQQEIVFDAAILMRQVQSLQYEELLQVKTVAPVRRRELLIPDMQIAHVEQLYERVDDVFSLAKFQNHNASFLEFSLDEDTPNELKVEVHEAWILPVGYEKVHKAMWDYVMVSNTENSCQPLLESRSTTQGDVFIEQCTTTGNGGCDYVGQLELQFVVKSYVDQSSSTTPLIITSMMSRQLGSAPLEAHTDFDCWIRIVPSEDSKTQVQWVQRVTSMYGHSTIPNPGDLLRSQMMEKFGEHIRRKHKTVEAILGLTEPLL